MNDKLKKNWRKVTVPLGLVLVIGLPLLGYSRSYGKLEGKVASLEEKEKIMEAKELPEKIASIEEDVKHNIEAVKKVENLPIQVAVIQTKVEGLEVGQGELKQDIKDLGKVLLRAINGE